MFNTSNEESFRFRAYNVLHELKENEYIRDVTLIEWNNEYFWYVFETDYDMDFLYSRLGLSYPVEQYNMLFEHSYKQTDDKLTYIKENILSLKAKETYYSDGAYKHVLIENDFKVLNSYSLEGFDVIVVEMKGEKA